MDRTNPAFLTSFQFFVHFSRDLFSITNAISFIRAHERLDISIFRHTRLCIPVYLSFMRALSFCETRLGKWWCILAYIRIMSCSDDTIQLWFALMAENIKLLYLDAMDVQLQSHQKVKMFSM